MDLSLHLAGERVSRGSSGPLHLRQGLSQTYWPARGKNVQKLSLCIYKIKQVILYKSLKI
jgi:hypothetical protein